jgi:hypothetical protein
MTPQIRELQADFFEYIFGDKNGYVCISTAVPEVKSSWKDHFFRWPAQRKDVVNFIQEVQNNKNVWFGVNLLDKAKRLKENCLPTNLVWADLDAQKPDTVEPVPSSHWQSSPGRYQAIWRLGRQISPDIAEEYSKRIAYAHDYIDRSGWDLTQVLRVPFSRNFKYDGKPQVELLAANEELLSADIFEALPEVIGAEATNGAKPNDDRAVPDIDELSPPEDIIARYSVFLDSTDFLRLFQEERDIDDDWSKLLWKLINICIEAGMDTEEVFSIAHRASCNKYERDGRPPRYLWRDILKAENLQRNFGALAGDTVTLALPELYDEKELKNVPEYWLDEFASWGARATDAIESYHALTGAIALSATIAAGIRLETTYGDYVPNLWGLVLGESSVTRKTTAMQMVTNMLGEIDDSLILATDGSAEGLLTALSLRPNRVSVFYKDEVSGFFDSINRKDYLAGMPETLTQLYDVPKFYTRVLRKETIKLSNPVFIFFGGGIKDRVYSMIAEDYILSGFIPRFLVISGEAELEKLRPTMQAAAEGDRGRAGLLSKLADLHEQYGVERPMTIADQEVMVPVRVKAFLTEEAWERYATIEMEMTRVAFESTQKMLALPTFERLARSLLKLALLLGASRQEPKKSKITIELYDIIKAASYIQEWGQHSIDLLRNCGIAATEHNLRKVLKTIEQNPGILRGDVMRWHHLQKRDADDIFSTLEERGQIHTVKKGRGCKIWAT